MSEWISVKEHLPQYGQTVLFRFTERRLDFNARDVLPHAPYGMAVREYRDDDYSENDWKIGADLYAYWASIKLLKITHWMPLPEPPK